MIAIVDYGMCNVGSVRNMLKKVGCQSIITSDKADLEQATQLILPGVGSFDRGMEQLAKLDLIDTLNRMVLEEKKPVLGICLGMQLLTERSEEGVLPGLGWIKASAVKFDLQESYKIPHMGWNLVKVQKETGLTKDFYDKSRFYFVHSYFVKCEREEDILLSCQYDKTFTAAVHRDNIYGVQFHPEKSHKYGMRLLKNFAELQTVEQTLSV